MKNLIKRSLTIILSGIIAAVQLPAFAADFSDISKNDGYFSEVTALAETGIIQGDNGSFRPEDEITRAEFAAILCRAMGETVEEQARSEELINKNWYDDVPPTHWAAGYINTATAYSAAGGFGDGTFRPEEPITNEQAIKTLIAAWGYKGEAESLGGYPNGYMEIAKRFGVTDTVLFNYKNASKRWVVSMFVYGVLEKLPISETAQDRPNTPITLPALTESAERGPIPENSSYIKDPVSILKKVTSESARYERATFEQTVPQSEFPFIINGNAIYGASENIGYNVYVGNPDSKEAFVDDDINDGGVSLESLPERKWQIQFLLRSGAVSDVYFCDIIKSASDISFGFPSIRYTTLKLRQITTEIRNTAELSNGITDEHFPFGLRTELGSDGKGTLYVDYEYPITDNQYFSFSLIDRDNYEDEYTSPFIDSATEKTETFKVDSLSLNAVYSFTIGIGEKTGGGTLFKGTLILRNSGNFLLQGDVVTTTVVHH
jgi:hypothetical protein